ncbi:ClpX C4-type zinc finger protein [Arthrobacter roseus]|uniref:ClpX C4-type zinc finger protein n=1 Tax=Arthrobacter roseus TaxID=136274 RepID=UPI001965C5C7|nr:ClpX C4-type zinc finger protein [Arthrobacter roseus]MBM7847042.1 hypothetical protein [Arthrobacter roseus]
MTPQTPNGDFCSFCSAPWSEHNRLVSGPGVAICLDCTEKSLHLFDKASGDGAIIEPPKELDDDGLLLILPQVADVSDQVTKQLQAWVDLARGRGISWARIGNALNITRQSAWERFCRTSDTSTTLKDQR